MLLPRFAAVATILSASLAAHASPATVGTYYEFQFAGAGSSAAACDIACSPAIDPASTYAGSGPYTFTFTGPGTFAVQDLFTGGDQFGVYDGTIFLGNTSAGSTTAYCGDDITVCSKTAGISKGIFALGSGTHSINIVAVASPLSAGVAVFEALGTTPTVTPEPSGIALLTTGLLGVAGIVRKRLA